MEGRRPEGGGLSITILDIPQPPPVGATLFLGGHVFGTIQTRLAARQATRFFRAITKSAKIARYTPRRSFPPGRVSFIAIDGTLYIIAMR